MQLQLDFWSFAVDVIGPVILLIAFGYGLYKNKSVDELFVQTASNLVFNFALPALLFITISNSELSGLSDFKTISIGISATLLVFIILLVLSPVLVPKRVDRGVVIQGAFRSNMGIIGLAYCFNAYGQTGLAYGSIYLGGLTIVYNLLSVGVLNIFNNANTSIKKIILDIAQNPIILSIILGLIFSYYEVKLPTILGNSLSYFSQLTLPLALLCTGAALRFSTFKSNASASAFSIVVKCIIYPFVVVAFAILFEVEGMALVVVFLMASCPTAAASYVMVRKIGGNHELAAQIIAISTVLSVPCTLVGYALLKMFM